MPKGKDMKLLLLPALLLVCGLAWAEDAELPVARALRIDIEPTIDGRLDEDFWQEAPVQQPFIGIGRRRVPPQETEFRVAYNDRALIVGITCHEKEMDRLTVNALERDGPVWSDDSVELFLAPGNGYYYQFAVNSAGVIYDGRRPARVGLSRAEMRDGLLWAGAWGVGVWRGPDMWSVEIRLPFALLDPHKGFADSWRINVGRTEPRFGYSCWAPVKTGFHDLDRYGYLQGVSVDTSPYVFDASGIEFPGFRIGRNRFRLAVPVAVANGVFDVKTSVRQWRSGTLPERQVNREGVEVGEGVLEIDLDVAVTEPLAMNELVVEIAEARTGLPVLLATHLFRVPKPLESSAPWTVYFGDDGAVGIENRIEVSEETMPGVLDVVVFRMGTGQAVFQGSFPVVQPGTLVAPVPLERLPQDGVYEAKVTLGFDGLEEIADRLTFYKHSARRF